MAGSKITMVYHTGGDGFIPDSTAETACAWKIRIVFILTDVTAAPIYVVNILHTHTNNIAVLWCSKKVKGFDFSPPLLAMCFTLGRLVVVCSKSHTSALNT